MSVHESLFTMRPITQAGRISYRLLRGLGVMLTTPFWRIRVVGRERLPVGVPFVVAPVHRSYVDFLIVAVAVPRVMRYMVKDSVWRAPRVGRFIEFNGSFPVDREHADREALRNAERAVQGGDPVVMFPEGRRKDGPVVEDLFDGPSFVACRNRVPIVPIGIGGSDRAMPIGKRMVRPAHVRVVIGEPIYPDVPVQGRVPRRVVTENTERLRERVQALYDEAKALVPAGR
ncbi:MAG: lysophospholipid acyltransferase family protein [Microthrixaceae bacterium]